MRQTVLSLLVLACLPGVLLEGVWLRGEVPYTKNSLEANSLPWSRLHPPGLHVPNPVTGDDQLMFIPWDMTLRREWKSLVPPLWNPYAGIGAPMLGNPQNQTLDPVRLISLAFTARRAPAVRTWLRMVLAAWFMFGLLRHLGTGRLAACLGAVAVQLGGCTLPWIRHPNGEVALLLPALIWAGSAVLRGGGKRAFLGLVAVYAWQFLAGHPETTLNGTSIAVLFWLGLYFRAGLKRWCRLAFGLITGGILAAPLLIPFFEYLLNSRAAAERVGGDVLLHVSAAATFALPRLFGWPLTGDWTGAINACETVAYVGVIPWLLIPFAFLHRPYRRIACVLLATAALCGMAAYGAPGFSWVLERLPGFSISANRRLILGIALAGAVVGALGLDVLFRERHPPKGWAVGAAFALAVAGLLAAAAAARWSASGQAAVRRDAAGGFGVFIALASVSLLIVATMNRRWLTARWAFLFVPLLVLDLRLAWGGYHTTVKPEHVLPTTPAIEALRARVRPGDRVLALGIHHGRMVLTPNTPQAFGLAELKIYDALGNEDFRWLFDRAIHFVPATGVEGYPLSLFGAKWVAIPVPMERYRSATELGPGQEHVFFPGEDSPPQTLELVSYLIEGRSIPDGVPVGVLEALDAHSGQHTFPLRAGRETADGAVVNPQVASSHPPAETAHLFTVPDGTGRPRVRAAFRATFPWRPEWGKVQAIRLRYTRPRGRLRVEGVGLLDERGDAGPDERARPFFRGELFLYRHPRPLPRAFLLREAPDGSDLNEVLRRLPESIRPAEVLRYEPELVVIRGEAQRGDTLVLTDAGYPGWTATFHRDGRTHTAQPRKVLRAFRGVDVPVEGPFTVTFTYAPVSLKLGIALFALGLVVLIATLSIRPRPEEPSRLAFEDGGASPR